MLSSLKKTLSRTKKYKTWQQAYTYQVCHEILWTYLQTQLKLPLTDLQMFFKLTETKLSLTLASPNSTLVAWLKTNKEELQEHLTGQLLAKDFPENKSVELKFRRR